jgi:ferredoxin-NADP reductase/predicted pyridoxine 5'-phosphate oxidase superfamily flavin-nucleotide-binding protein
MTGSPFHVGEQYVQTKLGVRESIEPWARRVIRGYLPDQHREFYSQLPFVVAAARDARGRPWVTLLTGPRGFVQSPDAHQLLLKTTPLPGDALEAALAPGAELGLLGIELETRRRNRVNGTITETGAAGIRLDVGQTFGNCPQYITERIWYAVEVGHDAKSAQPATRLDAGMREWITAADTLFIASGYRGGCASATFGMDASHRGGTPGFVKVASDTRLVFPDYVGNNHFNTIGNLVMDPGVGLSFVDFGTGSVLQMTGEAHIDWDSAELANHPGAQRLVIVDLDEIVRLDRVLPLRWTAPRGLIRSLRVVRKTRESDDVVSLELAARDREALPDFDAGQHLPIKLDIDGEALPITRTYSLSNAPGRGYYRISVKREPGGLVSNLLHDVVMEGAIISSGAPAGDFALACSGRPVLLIGAGIGVTPLLSMLHQLTTEPSARRIVFVYGARDGRHHAFADEIRTVAKSHPNVYVHVTYSRPRNEDRLVRHYDREGRVTGAVIEDLAAGLDADFYVCGPPAFLGDITTSLEALGIEPARVHIESFTQST